MEFRVSSMLASAIRKAGLGGLGLGVLIAVVGSIGDGASDPVTALALVLVRGIDAAWAPGLLLLAAVGYGRLGDPIFRGATERGALRLAVGLGIVLEGSHLLGVFGGMGTAGAWALVGIGLALWASMGVGWVRGLISGGERQAGRLSHWWFVGLPAVAVLCVASVSAPGWLWDSEFGGYDALAYHLTLPEAWAESGRVWPDGSNVYSFLPSYVESTFAVLMALAPMGDEGALGGGGWRLLSAQVWHATLGVCAAWILGAVVRRILEEAGIEAGRRWRAGALGGAAMLSTPWVVVTGSMAYNEMGVLALGAGSLLLGVERGITPWIRGLLCGALVGVACGAKPTAVFMLTPVVGALLLAGAPRRDVLPVVMAGVVGGGLSLLPWTVRNWIAVGNPVFPHLTDVFGTGPWSAEQAARYASGHVFDGSVTERAMMLVAPDADAGERARAVERWRGITNPQFGAAAPAAIILGVLGAWVGVSKSRIWLAALAIGLVVQTLAWMALTHLQSRFLIPCVLPMAGIVGIAIGSVERRRLGRPVLAAGVALALGQGVVCWALFAGQRGGAPSGGLVGGAGFFSAYEGDGNDTPWATINGTLPEDAVVLLVGESRTLYIRRETLASSTWDVGVLGAEIRESPDEPGSWARALRTAGVTHALVDLGELDRLGRSGWSDPALTPGAVMGFLEQCRPVRLWRAGPEGGRVVVALVELPEGR